MAKLTSQISATEPGPNVFVGWAIQVAVVAALSSLTLMVVSDRFGLEAFVTGMIVTLPVNLVIFGFSMLYWVPRMEPRSWLIQDLELDGQVLVVRAPAVFVRDLGLGYAARLGRDGERWSITFLRDGEAPLTVLVESSRTDELPGQGRFVQPPWLEARSPTSGLRGLPEYRRSVGDALLAALEATASENRFVDWQKKLATRDTSTPDEPFAVRLAGDDDAALDAYRSGRPSPGQPGFLAWAEREGLRLTPELVLSPEHLVVTGAAPIAFPIGATTAELVPTGLRLTAPDRAGGPVHAEVAVEDAALAAALAELLG